jgi:hypothetical protein
VSESEEGSVAMAFISKVEGDLTFLQVCCEPDGNGLHWDIRGGRQAVA